MMELLPDTTGLRKKAEAVLRRFEGPLTRDMVLEPSRFGLGMLPGRLQPDATTTSVCGFCSTGCGLNIHLREGSAINLTPSPKYPVNMGMACPKGWEALSPLAAPDRALTPMLRGPSGELEAVDWTRALDVFVDKFKSIQKHHGADSVAFLSTGQISTEEMALLGALAKFGMGMIHGDSNTRQCMATSAVAYKQSFGFDAPPFTYRDFEESDVLVFVGANPCIAHPILWERVLRNRRNPEIIVIDPRRTETAMAAHRHVALRPKSDLSLFYGLAQGLVERGWVDEKYIAAHTVGMTEFAGHVQDFKSERVLADTGIDLATFEALLHSIRPGKRVSFWWTMGVNQGHQGVRTAQAIINLALIGGHMGKPGTGANSITGQTNAMGSRLFANITNLLGGRDFTNPDHRAEVAGLLGFDKERIPSENSLPYHRILEEVDRGKIKGLWIIATNPAHSWINSRSIAPILAKLDFLVVQDMYTSTETVGHAHLLLPAAGWGEKEGTVINSERRIGLIKKVRKAPGQALADFHIFRLIAAAWGVGDMFKYWTNPEAVFKILRVLSRDRPCDISGILDYAMLDRFGGVQWPCRREEDIEDGQRRLFGDGRFFHADGKARILFEPVVPPPEEVDEQYPFVLLSGRGSSAQWHTQTRTGKSDVLRKLYPQHIYVEIHPEDAAACGIVAGAMVRVSSRRGDLEARALPTPTVQKGQIFIPMHYPETNRLTRPTFDTYSHQPSYKHCAVKVERVW